MRALKVKDYTACKISIETTTLSHNNLALHNLFSFKIT